MIAAALKENKEKEKERKQKGLCCPLELLPLGDLGTLFHLFFDECLIVDLDLTEGKNRNVLDLDYYYYYYCYYCYYY